MTADKCMLENFISVRIGFLQKKNFTKFVRILSRPPLPLPGAGCL